MNIVCRWNWSSSGGGGGDKGCVYRVHDVGAVLLQLQQHHDIKLWHSWRRGPLTPIPPLLMLNSVLDQASTDRENYKSVIWSPHSVTGIYVKVCLKSLIWCQQVRDQCSQQPLWIRSISSAGTSIQPKPTTTNCKQMIAITKNSNITKYLFKWG